MLNNRPLTSVSDDVTVLEPLTPNHFLIGRGNPNFRSNTLNEADIDLRKQWKSVQAASSVFWKQWVEEYLPLLTQQQKWRTQIRNFEQGDLVLISSKDIARSNWPLVLVLDICQGEDDVIPVVKVKEKVAFTRDQHQNYIYSKHPTNVSLKLSFRNSFFPVGGVI